MSFKKKIYWWSSIPVARYTVGKGDIIFSSKGADRYKATSWSVRNDPCEYSDWHKRIQI